MSCHSTLTNLLNQQHGFRIKLMFFTATNYQKGDLSNTECGMVVVVRSVPETADLLGVSCTIISGVCREKSENEKISSDQQFSG